jgi:hypothetical protein
MRACKNTPILLTHRITSHVKSSILTVFGAPVKGEAEN